MNADPNQTPDLPKDTTDAVASAPDVNPIPNPDPPPETPATAASDPPAEQAPEPEPEPSNDPDFAPEPESDAAEPELDDPGDEPEDADPDETDEDAASDPDDEPDDADADATNDDAANLDQTDPPLPWRKLVITQRGDQAFIGYQTDGTDAYIVSVPAADIHAALEHAPSVITDAAQRWETEPRGKTYDRPKPASPSGRKPNSNARSRRKTSVNDAPDESHAAPTPPAAAPAPPSEQSTQSLRLF